jgi:hypothetical protein
MSQAARGAARLTSARLGLLGVGGSVATRTSAVARGCGAPVGVGDPIPLDQISAAESKPMPVARAATCDAAPFASRTSRAMDGGGPFILRNRVATMPIAR